jgi:hypothetical protein
MEAYDTPYDTPYITATNKDDFSHETTKLCFFKGQKYDFHTKY